MMIRFRTRLSVTVSLLIILAVSGMAVVGHIAVRHAHGHALL